MPAELRKRKPWTWGPLELIRHANGHYMARDDTDRRIALIGFDNAVEVCIDVFLNLNPMLRGGYQLEREAKQKALRNYHTKIEFYDSYVQETGADIRISVPAIVWYHSLRNQLYHSGNGMVPEAHVIEGARQAAIDVFRVLFGESVDALLEGQPASQEPPSSSPTMFMAQNDEMELLRLYIELEQALQDLVPQGAKAQRLRTAGQLWQEFARRHHVDRKWSQVFDEARTARNRIAHEGGVDFSEDEQVALAVRMMELTDFVRATNQRPGG
jgi:hypothetical protein